MLEGNSSGEECDNRGMKTAQVAYERFILALGYSACAVACVFLTVLLLYSARVIPVLILGVIGYGYILQRNGRAQWPMGKLWTALLLVVLFVRVDISWIDQPGPPRLVPCVIGMPTRRTIEKAKRGDVVLRGCTATLLEPVWVLVW